MYESIGRLDILEVGLLVIALKHFRDKRVGAHHRFALELGDSSLELAEEVSPFVFFEVDKFFEGLVVWRVAEGRKEVAVDFKDVTILVESVGQDVQIDEGDQ